MEVDIAGKIDEQKVAHKDERGKLKHWGSKAKEYGQLIAERDGERGTADRGLNRRQGRVDGTTRTADACWLSSWAGSLYFLRTVCVSLCGLTFVYHFHDSPHHHRR